MTIDLAPRRPAGLRLRHPVVVAAGGAGYGNELLDAVGEVTPGAIVTRSTTREPRSGNPPPRMVAAPHGLLSSVGLQNPGLDAVLRRQSTRWAASDVPVIVSICGEIVDDIAALARTLDMQPDVAGVELNLACPDRGRSGQPIGLDVEASEIATVAARAATDLPLVVKLTAATPDVRAVARAVAAAGADAISAIAPVAALSLDSDRGSAALGTAYGGLTGPAVKPVALRVVYEIAQVVHIPIIGCGGVATLDDVLDMLAAGATAVGIATAALADPWLPGRMGEELLSWCRERGLSDSSTLVGAALPPHKDRGSLRRGPFRP
jgi:dihydroorotate dehydrogenase (NAD+) catalytic subunit